MIRYETMPARSQRIIESAPFQRFEFPDGTVWTELHRAGPDYMLRFPGLADFDVSGDGTAVTAYPVPSTDADTLEHLYINQIVPLALSRQGRPSFHASVVTISGGAVAFLGETGMGKSTLAASFALEGAEFLSDDSLLIEETKAGRLAIPSHASLRLWADSVEALVDRRTRRAAGISYSTKARLLAGEALSHRAEPLPLLAAYLLERKGTKEATIRELAGTERHMAWVNNSFLLDIEDRELLAQHFDWTHRIAMAVPTFALDYPRDYDKLQDVRKTVQEHVANLLSDHGS
jgi:hypothetical protein